MPRTRLLPTAPLYMLSLGVLCACPRPGLSELEPQPPPPASTPDAPTSPTPGSSDFLSADGYAGQDAPNPSGPARPPSAAEDADVSAGDAGGEREVAEGDIYRVLEGGLLANLNSYRGLQLVDFSDPNTPHIVGRLPVTGTPVEMYVRNDVAYLLLNDWRGYAGSRFAADLDVWEGGIALAVDVSDPAQPIVLDRAVVPGAIRKSRMVFNDLHAALYVVTGGYDRWENEDGSWTWESRTIVQSFDVSDGNLTKKTQLNLGGYVADIQATPEALLVARNNWTVSDSQSQVSIVDISDPSGTMVEGDEVTVSGYVSNQFNLDLYQGVLRVVSGSRWGNESTNHLETFDASDIQNLVPIDHDTFGDGQDLYATLFLGNKAFFVTYRRVDPFHAFEITDEGMSTEKSEFVVSGWNDFFRPVSDETRLIGIGVNDESSRTMAVSLYDITDLSNAVPLIQRAEVDAESSWSEASFDHRAFSVLENAVQVQNADIVETGLILLPFSGWSQSAETYVAGVQIFTFSDNTLTRRGFMEHGTPVRRSFLAEESVTANLSEATLSFFQTQAPDSPEALGSLELAPNYTDILPLRTDYALRVTNSQEYYWGWWGANTELPPAKAEVISRGGDIDMATPIATLEIPNAANTYVVGDLFVTAEPRRTGEGEQTQLETEFVIYDLSDPTVPVRVGDLQVADLALDGGYGYWGFDDCFQCYFGYGGSHVPAYALEENLVFPTQIPEQEEMGLERTCYVTVAEPGRCDESEQTCVYWYGNVRCSSLDGAPESCTGEIQRCTYTSSSPSDGEESGEESYSETCEAVEVDSVQTEENCYEYTRIRYWRRYVLQVLDLRDPATPTLRDSIELPHQQDGVNVIQANDALWLTTREPVVLEDDPRPYLRYFANRIRPSDDGNLSLDAGINVPGTLVAANGTTLFTRDLLWGESSAETWIHRLQVQDRLAVLEQSRSFADSRVDAVQLDGAGHLVVTHRAEPSYGGGVVVDVAEAGTIGSSNATPERAYQKLTLLDANATFTTLSEVDVDTWASLQDARQGRALFQVPGGLLLMNTSDASQPYPQAYFPTRTWPRDIVVDDDDIMFAAGRYGLYRFGLNDFNLLAPDLF